MGVDVIHRRAHGGQSLLHAARGAFTGWRHHVVAIGGGAEAHQLGQDGCAPRARMLQRFQHQHAAAAGDHEAVARRVEGARGLLGPIVVAGGHGAHRIEQQRHLPALFFAAAGEDHVLLVPGDQLRGVPDAVRAGRAGRGDGVVDALDAERRGQAGRDRAAHGARDHERADAFDALAAQRVGGQHLVRAGGATGAGDQPGARVRNLCRRQTGLLDGLLHRQIRVGRRVAHETQRAAVDHRIERQLGAAAHLAAQAALGVDRVEAQARTPFAQAVRHVRAVVAQARDDALTGDDDSTHQKPSVDVNKPTLRSVAT